MLKKIKNPANFKFSYNPRIREINIFFGQSFYYNDIDCTFEVDQNPHGEPDLAAIQNLEFLENYDGLNFDANYRNRDTSFRISSDAKRGKILLGGMDSIAKNRFQFPDSVLQRVSLICEGNDVTIEASKTDSDGEDIDSLWIFSEDGVFYLVIPKPWARFVLDELNIDGNRLSMKFDGKTAFYDFSLDPLIMNLVGSMIRAELATS
jgi:hypothetical protein